MEKKRIRENMGGMNLSISEQIAKLKTEINELHQKNNDASLVSYKENIRYNWLSDFYSSIPGIAFLIDDNAKLIIANESACDLFGYKLTDIERGVYITDVVPKNQHYIVLSMVRQLFLGEEVEQGSEITITSKKNKEVPVLVYFKPLFENGIIVAAIGLMVDFSEFKKAEEELIYAKEFAELIYNVSPSAIFTVNNNRVITSWNRMAEEITGYAAFEAIGKRCDLFTGDACINDCKLKEIDKKNTPISCECAIVTKDGEKRIIRKNSDFLRSKTGEIIGGIESFTDITSTKKLIDDLITARKRAEESDQLKSSFLANMSHEIRTPVNGIIGFTELLKESTLSFEEREEYLSIIKQSGNQLLTLINDIVDLSKIEANQLAINKENFSLNLLLEELKKLFKNQVEKTGKDIELKLVKDEIFESDIINSDPFRLRQILINLLSNAVKFTNHGSIVFGYKVSLEKQQILFFVRDTGVGIPKSQQQFIFERFAQVSSRGNQNAKGTGLGLAISKGILDMLGGTISIESAPGAGAEFTFTIPLVQVGYCKIKRNKKSNVMNYNWSNKTLLIAEDDHVNYKYLEITLLRTKLNVIRAVNGQQAVELCKNHSEIDAVLMDIQMPVMDGYEATQKIKSFRNDLPIIAQTANAMDDDEEKCLDAGCDDYITKPISHDILFDLLERIFNMKYHVS